MHLQILIVVCGKLSHYVAFKMLYGATKHKIRHGIRPVLQSADWDFGDCHNCSTDEITGKHFLRDEMSLDSSNCH